MRAVLRYAVSTAALVLLAATPVLAGSLTADAIWSGKVKVEGLLVVEKGATLTIEPGTNVVFAAGKLDEEGLSDSGMLVKGAIVADGRDGARITFTSGRDTPAPGDWGEIKLFSSAGSSFKDCDFSYGGWGMHLHDSDLKVAGCTFADNSFGGIRMKGGRVEVSGCRMAGMEIGIRYWQAGPAIHHNTITGNKTGIFCRQECEGSIIKFNNIYGNTEYDMKLGDVQKEDVDACYNWWGTPDTGEIRKKIYDRERDEYVGKVLIEPVLTKEVEAR